MRAKIYRPKPGPQCTLDISIIFNSKEKIGFIKFHQMSDKIVICIWLLNTTGSGRGPCID